MRIRRLAIAVLSLGFIVLECAQADAALHPGDKVAVTVYNHPELSGTRTVDASGNVSVPLAGLVPANESEPAQFAERVRSRIAPYVRNAAVDVQLVEQTANVFIAGGPVGVVHYEPGETLANLVDRLQAHPDAQNVDGGNAQATATHDVLNGPLDLVNGPIDFHNVAVQRDGRSLGRYDVVALRDAGQSGPALRPGDTIRLVNKPVAVTVQGDVQKPGTAHLDTSEPLSQAITQVGGVTANSSETGLILTRGSVTTKVALGSPEMTQTAQSGDRLVVPRAPRVDVLGNVDKPGQTMLRGDATLVSAIYYAGGPAKYANLRSVGVVHQGVRTTYDLARIRKGDTGQNPALADGDVVFVPQGSTFQLSDLWQALGSLGLFGLKL